MRTLCLFGTYDPTTARLQRLKAGWESQGGRVIEMHAPVWPASGARAVMAGRGQFPVGRLLAAQQSLWAQRARLDEADVVLVPYPGHFDMLLASRVCRAAGKPLAFDPFVSLYETAVSDRALYAPGSGRARLTRQVDRVALRLADRVLADTGAHGAHFVELGGIERDKVRVVPLGADEGVFRGPDSASRPHPTSPTSWGGAIDAEASMTAPVSNPAVPLPQPPPHEVGEGRGGGAEGAVCNVLFYGSMIPLHGIDTLLEAARLLAAEPGIRFHLVGSGQVPIERLLAEAKLPNVRWTPWVPYEALPALLAGADVALGLFGATEKAARVVPHKVYEAAAMGRAIVTADTPAMREAFPDASVQLVPPADARALAEALRELAVAPVRRSQLGEAARAQFLAAYDTRAIGAALVRALDF